MRHIGAIAALAALMAPAAAQADTGLYAGVGYTNYSLGDFEDMGALTARVGYRVNDFLGVEGEYSTGMIDGDYAALDAELEGATGAFIVGSLPVSERFELFARAGYAESEVFASGSCGVGCTTTASTEDEGVAYGVGVQFKLTERFALRGDYTHADGDFRDIDAFGFSGVVEF